MANFSMGLAQALTSASADRVQSKVGIKTLKMAMDTQKNIASQMLEELGKSAYQAAGIGQTVDIRA
jgi:hypothetical protein